MISDSLSETIAQIKKKIKPSDLAVLLGFTPKRGMINCPYHEDKNPSMSCHDETGNFRCFSPACSKHERSVDIVSFYRDQKKLSFSQAVQDLATQAGVELQETRSTRGQGKGFPTIEAVLDFYQSRLKGFSYETNYLWHDFDARLSKVVFKFIDPLGNKEFPQAFFSQGKWLLSKPERMKAPAPYNWHNVKDSPTLVICEGEKDTETAKALGLPAITTGSAGSWKKEFSPLFKARDVIIIPDKDEAGRKYADAILSDLRPIVRSIKCLTLQGEEGIDLTDYVKQTESGLPSLQSLIGECGDIKHVWEAPAVSLRGLERIPAFIADEMLPESLRFWLEYLSEDLQCPIDALAAPAIAALSILIGRKLYVQPKEHSTEFLVAAPLWCVLMMPAGDKKSQILKKSLQPLVALNDRLQKENLRIINDLEASMKCINAEERQLESDLAEALRKNNREKLAFLRKEMARLSYEKGGLQKQSGRYLVIGDVTPERAMEILAANPNGALLFADELSGWWRSLSKGQMDQRKIFLESWGGITINIERKSYRLRGESILSVVGGVQPDWLSHVLEDIEKGGKENDGLINRFALLINPDRSTERWTYVDRKPAKQAFELYEGLFQEFFNFKTTDFIPDWQEGDLKSIPFSEEARSVFIPWLVEKENNLREKDYAPVLSSHFSKYTSLFCSLALIFHVVLVLEGVVADRSEVSRHAAELAKKWCDYLAHHAVKTFGRSVSYDSSVRSFAKRIVSGEITDGMSRRDIQRSSFPHLKDSKALDRAVEELSRLQILKVEDSLERQNGSKVIRINPGVLSA